MATSETLELRLHAPDVANSIRADGYCFLESLFPCETIRDMLVEFDRVFNQRIKGVAMGSHPPGRMATIDTVSCRPSACPTIFSAFLSPTLEAIARAVLPEGSGFCEKISLTHEQKSGPITNLHFDSQRSLKFMVYLQDTDRRNAAFGYVRGSHLQNTAYRNEFLARGGHLLDLQNVAAGMGPGQSDLDRLKGPAGSMVIFDTDGWHSAGQLQDSSKERKVIRSRSHFAGQPPLWPRRYTPMWFRRTFNLLPPRPPFELPDRHRTEGTSRKT